MSYSHLRPRTRPIVINLDSVRPREVLAMPGDRRPYVVLEVTTKKYQYPVVKCLAIGYGLADTPLLETVYLDAAPTALVAVLVTQDQTIEEPYPL